MGNKKIAVMAGTPTDTNFGVKLVKNITTEILPLPISKTPEEQTIFQTSDYDKRTSHIENILNTITDIDALVVYCNSLSGSVDFTDISRKSGITIFTPLDFYRHIATKYGSLGVITANAQGAAGVEKEIINCTPNAKIYSISNLEWVKAVESATSPKEIFEKLGLKEILAFFEKVQVDCVVFGCTHFPYFFEYLQSQTEITCLNPDNFLLEKLENI